MIPIQWSPLALTNSRCTDGRGAVLYMYMYLCGVRTTGRACKFELDLEARSYRDSRLCRIDESPFTVFPEIDRGQKKTIGSGRL